MPSVPLLQHDSEHFRPTEVEDDEGEENHPEAVEMDRGPGEEGRADFEEEERRDEEVEHDLGAQDAADVVGPFGERLGGAMRFGGGRGGGGRGRRARRTGREEEGADEGAEGAVEGLSKATADEREEVACVRL